MLAAAWVRSAGDSGSTIPGFDQAGKLAGRSACRRGEFGVACRTIHYARRRKGRGQPVTSSNRHPELIRGTLSLAMRLGELPNDSSSAVSAPPMMTSWLHRPVAQRKGLL